MKKIIALVVYFASIFLAFSCQKGDGDVEYGNTYIYMPQAMATGGVDNFYRVPSTTLENNRNFNINQESVDVILGVLRSGKQSGESFSVDVLVDQKETEKGVAILKAEPMIEGMYTLPSKVYVDAGKNSTVFYMSLSKAELLKAQGKTLVLGVSIANPSAYELSSKATSTCVVVDVDNLVKLF